MIQDKTPQDLLSFLRIHDLATLATIKTGNIAHAATIYYHVDEKLNFYFLTKDGTIKFRNLQENHSVALVVSDPVTLQTVQVEGVAKEVNYETEYNQIIKEFTQNLAKNGKPWDKIPLNHLARGYYVFVRIVPTWIRWVDYKDWENTVQFEKTFSE